MQCALGNVAHEVWSDLQDGLPSYLLSRDLNIEWSSLLFLLQLMLLPLQVQSALRFREQQALRRLLCEQPSEQLCGGVYLWQRDELFRAQRYVFVET
jgi:hypothetical protein